MSALAGKSVFLVVLLLAQHTKEAATDDKEIESLNTTKPSFRIVAPQVICKRKSGQPEVELPKQITISMQTQGGQKLSYRVQMSFEVLGGFRGQQHSLSLWNCVRKLETKINVKNRDLISAKNQINVNNTELTPGVFYIFQIVGIDDAGIESEPQNYTVTFSDGSIKRINADGSVIPDDISLSLLGAELTFADVDYIVEADVFFCNPRNDYKFQWTMTGVPAEQSYFLRNPGALMRIPAGTLRAGGVHQIQASLLRVNDSEVLLYQSVSVRVVGRGHTITLTPELVSTGIGQPVEVSIIYRDSDNSGLEPIVTWSCNISGDPLMPNTNTSSETCDGFEISSTRIQKAEFYSQGNYIIQASVSVGDQTTVYQSMVVVQRDIIARPILGSLPARAVVAGKELRLEALVDDLIPYCYCFWEVLNETGFAYFDQSDIPNGLGNTTIVDIDGNFLSELVDYGNSTLSKDIQLLVPAKSETFAGLVGDALYKFRLNAICPAPITDLDDELDDSSSSIRQNVTSYVDVVVATNAPPDGRPLEITPQKGNALKTIFKFSTGVAGDVPDDYPLKYNFMVRIERFVISVGEYYENMVTTTVLPFSNDPIATMYEVCDSRSACSTVAGPNLTVRQWPMTDKELKMIVDRINASMWRLEYDNAFRDALMTGISLKQSNDQSHVTSLLSNLEQYVTAQAIRLHTIISNPSSEPVFVPPTEVVNFVNHARQTLSAFGDTNERIIEQLFKLLDLLAPDEEDDGRRRRRRKRSVITTSSTASESSGSRGYDEIQTMLDLAETLLRSSNQSVVEQAKTNLVQKVHQAMLKMCRKESSSPKSFERTSIKFEIRDITGKQLKYANHSVPLADSIMPAFVKFNGMLLIGNRPNAKFCLAKAMYPSDFVAITDGSLPREIFEIVVITLGSNKKTMIPLVDVTGDRRFEVDIPFYSDIDSDRLMCQVWDNTVWNDTICETIGIHVNYVKCKCSQVGFFRLSFRMDLSAQQELSTISADFSSPDPTLLTYIENEDMNLTTNMTPQSSVAVVTLLPDAVSLPQAEIMNEEPTKPTTFSEESTSTVPTTSGFIETTTLIAPKQEQTEPSRVTIATPNAPTENQTHSTSSFIAPKQGPMEPRVIAEPIHLMDEKIVSSTTDENTNPQQPTSTGYALAGGMLAVGVSVVTGLYVYHRRKHQPKSNPHAEENIVAELREPAAGVKYARFHDENTMRGDNIQTIFNSQSRF